MTGAPDRLDLLTRASRADRGIRALDLIVTGMCAAARATDGPACSGCIWKRVVKPLALPLVGWERGLPPGQAVDPGSSSWGPVDLGPALTRLDERDAGRAPATSDTERWLRSAEAWNAVTGAWIARLHDADPARGHGIAWDDAVAVAL